ncbi:ADP-ribosylglycohydrolase family protein [Winogradskyella sp.]|uniref:ADP-ribosylglycohydrolase family protein n=1 Tax=Winogradskyella sp. TaxID=1883156 RepID=UPI003BAC89E6
MTIEDRFEGCILCGAIGDAWGSAYEGADQNLEDDLYYPFGIPDEIQKVWRITDDTQLTLATIDAITNNDKLKAENIAEEILKLYRTKKIRGLGASTLKALEELNFGGHWSQVGRKGEYAAGNGAAMRIAPLAFLPNISDELIREICSITHQNDEAYIGALSIVKAIRLIIDNKWTGKENLIRLIVEGIPDSRVRDRLILIDTLNELNDICGLGNSAYVVDSVPLAIAFASRIKDLGVKDMFQSIINAGGDTDTNCALAGQIVGALVGIKGIPEELKIKLGELEDYDWIISNIEKFKNERNK